MYRSLIFHWRRYLPVLIATVIAAAVVTGALIVGDSVKESLRVLGLDRIGAIDTVLSSDHLVDESLAGRLLSEATFQKSFSQIVPIIRLDGSVLSPKLGRRTSSVAIHGITGSFGDLFDEKIEFHSDPNQLFPPVIINRSLSLELGVEKGDPLVFYLMKKSRASRETLAGRRDPSEVIQTIRGIVGDILEDKGIGQFALRPTQAVLLNAYFHRDQLQKAIQDESEGEWANMFLLKGVGSEKSEAAIRLALGSVLELEDIGLRILQDDQGGLVLESGEFFLSPGEVEGALKLARRKGLDTTVIFTYLANELRIGDKSIPYSTISAIEPGNGSPPSRLFFNDGQIAPYLGEEELYLNGWARDQLNAREGDFIDLTYYKIGPRNALSTESVRLRVAGFIQMDGLGVDPYLTPQFPGIHTVDDMAHWDPPFPIDLGQIRPQDEDYWDRYGAAPKAFVSLPTARKLWAGRYGDVTSIRFEVSGGDVSWNESRPLIERELIRSLILEEVGFEIEPIRDRVLLASKGPTDFAGLFIGFSTFLIIAALLLVVLLFCLATESRSQELGMLSALGYSNGRLRVLLLRESRAILVLGCALGGAASLIYAWIMLAGLRTWWLGAVGTTALSLHVEWQSILAGFVVTAASTYITVWLSLRRLLGFSATSLLSGNFKMQRQGQESSISRVVRRLLLILSIIVFLSSVIFRSQLEKYETELFFGLALLLLSVLLMYFSSWCRHPSGIQHELSWSSLAYRNSQRNATRSIFSVALIALASFTILSMAVNRASLNGDFGDRSSVTGGFQVVGQTEVPILQDINTEVGRFELGIDHSDKNLKGVHAYPMRLQPGDDVSCLNLYRPVRPRILGVPDDFLTRGGFTFSHLPTDVTPAEKSNPWLLLKRNIGEGVVPAIGDYESVQWILQSGLGQELEINDGSGRPLKLHLVGLLKGSLFQSELLISEKAFQGVFPDREGYSYFLIESEKQSTELVMDFLERNLGEYGFRAQETVQKLAGYLLVRNTYISTFETLGGLGLVLGTLGLGVVLLRNVVERRRELAIMRAAGFSRYSVSLMVIIENGWLLVWGLGIGFLSALIALIPNLGYLSPQSSLGPMLYTVILVFVFGMMASLVAVRVSLRMSLLPVLKTG